MTNSEGRIHLNPDIARVVCSVTGSETEAKEFSRPLGLCGCCPAPGKPLVVVYELDTIRERLGDTGWGTDPGIWRYGALLPVLGLPSSYAPDVGLTQAVRSDSLAGEDGVDALFSTRLSLPGCLVYMPEDYRGGLYHREAELFGAEVRFSGANIAAAGKTMRETHADELASGQLVDMSTFFEPGRLEGKKTMGELIALGRLDATEHRLPRMVAVQSENCAPVIEAFHRGLDHVKPVESEGTVADGLDVPGAIMGHGILATIRESGGTAVAVSEAAILDSFRVLGRNGIAASYEGAATLAALRKLRAEGLIAVGSRVLLLLTANHFVSLGRETT